MSHDNRGGVACKAARRFRGNVLPVLERRNSDFDRILEHLSVDVNDYLVSIARGARVEPGRERRLRQQDEGIGAALGGRQVVSRGVAAARVCRLLSTLLKEGVHGGFESTLDGGPSHRIETRSEDGHPVLVMRDLDVAAV